MFKIIKNVFKTGEVLSETMVDGALLLQETVAVGSTAIRKANASLEESINSMGEDSQLTEEQQAALKEAGLL